MHKKIRSVHLESDGVDWDVVPEKPPEKPAFSVVTTVKSGKISIGNEIESFNVRESTGARIVVGCSYSSCVK